MAPSPTRTNKSDAEVADLYKKHYALVHRTAFSITGNTSDADDVLHNIFVSLLGRELPADLQRNANGYFYRAAVNQSLKIVQSRQRLIPTADTEFDDIPASEDVALPDARNEERLRKAITKLGASGAEMLLLRYQEDYSIADIAKTLGKNRATVAMILYRVRLRLKKLLEGEI
jgi:RNA polymerase sigma-70 factor (ECF subfamily)